MTLIKILVSGYQKTLRSGKFVVLCWAVTFLLGTIFAFPLKAGLKSAAGNSIILDRINDGILIDIFADMGSSFTTITFMSLSGLILIFVAGLMVNAFLVRGIFGVMRFNSGTVSFSGFFSHSPKSYWSFLRISVMLRSVIFILSLIVIILPLSALGSGQTVSPGKAIVMASVAAICFLFIIPVFILVSDYARAWLVAYPSDSFWKSVGSGFSLTFNRFLISYFYVFLLCAMQVLFFLFIFSLIRDWKPSGAGTLVYVLLIQLIFIAGLLLRFWRFAGVTALMEQFRPVQAESLQETEIRSVSWRP